MSRAAIWIVAGLLASGAVLVGVELAKGALDEPSPKIANPCEPREGRTGGFDTTVQRIVLDGKGKILIDAKTIELGGDSFKAVLGDALRSLFNSHTHPVGSGSTGTPTQQMGSAQLSDTVRLK